MKFPTGKWGKQRLEFFPAPFRAPLRAFAALVFPWDNDKVLVCNIADRGWCIPSGRVELDEQSWEAAIREAHEEGGAILQEVHYIGCYRIEDRNEVRWADVFTSRVHDLAEILTPKESRGRRFCEMSELPEIYHSWNELTEAVFQHSFDALRRHRDMLALDDAI